MPTKAEAEVIEAAREWRRLYGSVATDGHSTKYCAASLRLAHASDALDKEYENTVEVRRWAIVEPHKLGHDGYLVRFVEYHPDRIEVSIRVPKPAPEMTVEEAARKFVAVWNAVGANPVLNRVFEDMKAALARVKQP